MFDYDTIVVALVLLFLYWALRYRRKFNRHKFNRKKAKKVLSKIREFDEPNRSGKIFSYLRKIDPFVFEELLLTSFESNGYKAIRNKRYTGDGGIDGKVIDQDGNLILVQAKRYSSYINRSHVEEFSGVVASHKKAKRGYFVHTGKTGGGAFDVLKERGNLKLISGSNLIRLIGGEGFPK